MESKPRQAPPTPVDELASLRQRVVALEARLAQVQESEAFYHGLVDSAGEAVLVVDARTGLVQECNRRAESLFGQPRAQIIGRPHTQLHPPAAAAQYVDLFRRVATGEVVGAAPTTIQRTDGGVIYVEVSASLHELGDQRLILGLFRDVTERTRSEEALRASEQRHRALFEHFGDAVLLLSDQGILDCNETALRLFGGTSRADLIGRQPWTLAPPTQPDGRSSSDGARTFARAAGAAGLARFEWMHQRLTGEPFPAEVLVAVFPTGDRRQLYAVIRDITERKGAEQALRESEQRLELALDISQAGVWEADLRTGRVTLDARSRAEMGFAPGEIDDTLAGLEALIHSEDRAAAQAAFGAHVRGETERCFGEHRVLRKDGSWAWVEYCGRVVERAADGTPLRVMGTHRDISERKRAEEELRGSEERFRQIAELTGQLIYDWNLASGTLQWSGRIQEITGYSPEEINAHGIAGWEARIHPADRARVMAHLADAREQRSVYRCEYRYRCADGTYIHVRNEGSFLCDPAHRPVRMFGVVKDVSEHIRALLEVEKLAAVVRHAGSLVNLSTLDGRMVFLNEAGCRMLGIEPDAVEQHSIQDVIPEECLAITQAEVLPAIQAGRTWDGELRYRNLKTGTLIDVHAMTFAVNDPRTGEVRYLANVSHDIGDRKRAEAALESTRLLLEAVIEQSPISTVIASAADGAIRFANHAAITTLGIADEDVRIGMSLQELQQRQTWRDLYPDGTPVLLADMPLARALRGETTWNEEYRVIRKDGTERWQLISGTPVYNRAGELIAGLIVFPDITERKRAEEERARLIAILEQTIDLVATTTLDGRFTYMNAAGRRLLGWSPTEDVSLRQIADSHPAWAHARIIATGIPTALANGVWQGETALLGPDGREVPVSQVIVAHCTETGEPIYLSTIMRDIREQRRAEEQLRLAEFSIERSGLPTTWFDRRGRVVRVNEAACQSLGYSRDELLQLAVRDFDPDFQDPEKWDGIWHEMRAHGRCLAFETRHRRKDGTCFPVEIVSSYFAYGQQEYIFSFARDITARRRSEAELRESERKYRGLSQEFRTILEAIPGSLVLISPDMKIVWANEYTKNTSMGLESGEMLGQHCYRCRHGLATPCEACPVQRCFVSGKPESGERDTPDGHIWELHAAPVWGDQGEIKGVIEVAHDVTDYRRADRELKASESRLRGLFRAAPIGILFTQHRTTVSVNDALCELLGHSQAELIGQTSRLSYFTEEEFQEVGRKLYGAVPAGGCASVETRLRRKDGTAIDVLLTSAPLHAEEPGAGFVVTMQDITERKRAEQALQSRIVAMTRPLDDASTITFSDLFDLEEIQNLQDAFAESSGVAALITAPDGTPLTRPSGFCRLCAEFVRRSPKGQQRCALSDAALGRDCRDGPTVRPCLSAGLWGAGASITVGGKHIANWLIGQVRDESLDLEQISRYAREIDADPEEFRRALLEVPAMSEAQFRKIARTLFVLSQELSSKAYQNVQQARFITDLKRAEDERDRLFNASIDLLSIGNLAGHFKQVNPAWTSSLGWSAEELTRTHPSEFVHPDDAAATVAAAERLRQGRALRSFENRFRCKNGSYRWLSWNAYAILEQGLVFAVGRDVTELKAAETERTRLEAQLRQSQKMEAIGQLAGGVAHDFNNILTAIFGNVDIVLTHLEQREYTAPGLLEHLQQVQRSAERAAGLTRQLLAFSRRQVIQPIVLDLNAALRDLEKMLRRLIAENIDLRLILAPAPAIVEVDPGQLEQVVVNLVVNARDAMADGGRLTLQTGHVVLDELHAATHADARTGPHILLEIADTGCGMSPDTLEHIFEPFFTTKPVGRGTGLGLSTVYGIVRQAGGHIDVQSAPGCGTHLRIYWPAARQPLPTTARSPASQAPPTGTETILICEDDDTVRGLATQILTDAGYQVLIAPTPHIALQTVQNHAGPLQLLITDVIMPDMNGRLLSEALVKLRPSLRTLFISGYTSDIIAHHGVPAESIEFLEKPFSPRALLLRVRQVLDKPAPPAGFTASPPDVQDRASG